jgi:hypothetical protein
MSGVTQVQDFDKGWKSLMAIAEAPKAETYIWSRVPYAVYLEYGFTHWISGKQIGPFPFIRFTLDAHNDYQRQLSKIARQMIDGAIRGKGGRFTTARSAMAALGKEIVTDIRETIQGMGLIKTGNLWRSIQATVRNASESTGKIGAE